MALKLSEKTDVNEYKLVLTVDGGTFDAALNKAYNRNKNKYPIPGFRKGKAPRSYIEKYYGNVFFEDALDDVFPAVYTQALEESGVEAVSSPFDFDLISSGKDGIEFSIKVTSKPEITLEGYKGIEAEKTEPLAVETGDVDHRLSHMQDENARIVDIDDRPVQEGDIANIDFVGYTDGKAFDGGKGDSYDLTIGSGTFIPGFEEQIVGHSVGEHFDVTVQFPEEYVEQLAGKDAVFKVTLNAIKLRELPALDDDFAKDVSEFDTLDELRADIKKQMEEDRQKESDRLFENNVLSKLAELVEGEIPECMYEEEIDRQIKEFQYRLQSQGIELDDYLKHIGADRDALAEQYRDSAETRVKVDLALDKIVQVENIEASAEELDAEYQKIADAYQIDVETVRGMVDEKTVKGDVLKNKAVKLVVAAAVPTAPKTEDEPAAGSEEETSADADAESGTQEA